MAVKPPVPLPSTTSSFPALYSRTPYMLAIRKQQDVDADLEYVCTLIWNDGRTLNWSILSLYLDYLPVSIKALDPVSRKLWLYRVIGRMQHHCMKCKVNCNISKHVCRDCLLCACIGAPVRTCDCFQKCEYSVLPVHAELSS